MRMLGITTKIVAVLGALGTLAILLREGNFSDWHLLALFAGWALAPYGLLWLASVLAPGKYTAALALLMALAAGGWGLSVYYESFYMALDPQSGLAFVFVPIYQLLATGVLCVALFATRMITRRRQENEAL